MRRVVWIIAALFIVSISLFLVLFNTTDKEAEAEFSVDHEPERKEIINELPEIPHKYGVPEDYELELMLDKQINEDFVTEAYIKVLNEAGEEETIQIELKDDNKTIHMSNNDMYEKGKTYVLHFTETLEFEDGKEIESGDQLRFTIDRDEVENITVNPDMIKIDKKDLKAINQTTVTIKKQSKPIKNKDILIVYPREAPDGYAIKVSSIKDQGNTSMIEYETPGFEELFEELDLYKNMKLDKSHIVPAEGVEVTKGLINDGPKYAFAEAPFNLNIQSNDNNDINFNVEGNYDFSGKKTDEVKNTINLAANVTLKNPSVIVHSKLGFDDVKELDMVITNEVESVIELSLGKEKENKLREPRNIPIKLGKILIPTTVPAVVVEVDLGLDISYDAKGEMNTKFIFGFINERGILYDGEELEFIHEHDSDFDIDSSGVTGKVELNSKAGVVMSAKLSAYKVVGIGAKAFGGFTGSGEFVAGYNDKVDGAYQCTELQSGLVAEGSGLINILLLDIEFLFAEHELSGPSFSNCDYFNGYTIDREEVHLKSKEVKKIKFQEAYIDLLTFKSEEKNVDPRKEKLDIKVEDDHVIDVEIKDNALVITADEFPEKEETNIVITDEENDDIVIPVSISDFDDIEVQLTDDTIKNITKRNIDQISHALGDIHLNDLFDEYYDYEDAEEMWKSGVNPETPFYKDVHALFYPEIKDLVTEKAGMEYIIDEKFVQFHQPVDITVFYHFDELEIISKGTDRFKTKHVIETQHEFEGPISYTEIVLDYKKEDGKWKLARGRTSHNVGN